MLLAVFYLTGCVNLSGPEVNIQLFEQDLNGKHAALAGCVAHQLQRDGRGVLRLLQIRNRQYPGIGTSEIYAYDTRYLRNVYAAYAPSNPDGILLYGEPAVEVLPVSQRDQSDQQASVFVLTLRQIDDDTVIASLKGDSLVGPVAWELLQRCSTTVDFPQPLNCYCPIWPR